MDLLDLILQIDQIDFNVIRTDPYQQLRTEACLSNPRTSLTHNDTRYYCSACGQLHSYGVQALRGAVPKHLNEVFTNICYNGSISSGLYKLYFNKHVYKIPYLKRKYITEHLRPSAYLMFNTIALSYFITLLANKKFRYKPEAVLELRRGYILRKELAPNHHISLRNCND